MLICIFFSLLLNNLAYSKEDLTEAQTRLDTITKSVQRIETKIAKNVKNHELVKKELAKLDKEIGKLHHHISQSKSKISNNKSQHQQLQKEKQQLKEALKVQSKLFKKQVRMAYVTNSQSKWKLLLSQTSLQNAGKNALIYDYIHQARLEEMEQINQLAEKIKVNQEALMRQQSQLEALLQQHDQEQSILANVRHQKQQAHTTLKNRIDHDKAALVSEKKQQKRLKKLLSKLKSEQTRVAKGKFASNTGKLKWPVKGKLQHKFGERSADAEWNGVSILAERGTDVLAIFSGEVVFADWFDHYGWLLIVDHGEDSMSLYAHAEGLYKNAGDYVTQGEVIAVVGDSGDAQQTGLYFEIRRQGAPVDPAGWCVYPKMAYSP